MIARWVPAFVVRISLIAAGLTAQSISQSVLADELTGVAKDFVGRWQAAPDLIYEFSAAGKFRIVRDPSKQPAGESRWPLPPNTVSCTVEGEFGSMDLKVDNTPRIFLRGMQTTDQRLPDGKLQRSTETFPVSYSTLYFLSKSDTPKRTITVTTSSPVSARDIAIVMDAGQGWAIEELMHDKKESEMNTRTWERLGD